METYAIAQNIYQNLQRVLSLPQGEGKIQCPSTQKLPFWLKGTVEIYSMPLVNEITVQLVIPKNNIPFKEAVNAIKVISRHLHGPILLLADSFPAKTHGPLARMKIPFITSQGTLFAPQLGMMLTNAFNDKEESELKVLRMSLASLGVKLIAAHLLSVPWAIKSFSNLHDLQEQFHKIGYATSRMSLSRALHQLSDLKMIHISGLGPQKTYRFPDREELWRLLTHVNVDGPAKKTFSGYLPHQDEFPWVKSGESALEVFTDLAQGPTDTIAMKLDVYNRWIAKKRPGTPYGDFGSKKLLIEIWKSDPCLLSMDGALNEIELALCMRNSSEPRVRIAIKSMLENHQLDASELWKDFE